MKVKVLSVRWEMGHGITVTDFANFLSRVGPGGINFNALNRQIYVNNVSHDYFAGVMLTLRDQTRFLTATGAGSTLRITPAQLSGAGRIADCNLFLVHHSTGRGLYTHYHHSVGVSGLQAILRRHYSTLKDTLIAHAAVRYAAGGELRGKHEKKARRDYKGMLSVPLQLRTDSLSSILDDITEVREDPSNIQATRLRG
jgi:hypothetical protein